MSRAVNVEGLRDKLQEVLLAKVQAGKLVLPSIPTTTSKVLEAIEAPEIDVDEVSKLLQNDPLLSLDLLRLVNSSAFSPKAPVENISRAITMVGAQRLRQFLITASAKQIFVSRIPKVREVFSQLWTHSVGVAVVARQVALHSGLEDKDAPYFAGLMHDVGKPIAAVHLLELEKSVSRWQQSSWIDPNDWLSIIEDIHRPVGIAVANQWRLSEQVTEAISDCVEYDPAERLCASNAVRFANALAKREGVAPGNVDMTQVNTVLMIGRSILGLDDEAIEGMSQSLHQAVAELA